jgi:SAM-dependent methyltransferase
VSINPVAAGGFASAAATYARIRPAYARAAIGAIKDLVGRGGHVLDVAAGTGILTGQLVRAGLDATAVEPVAEMVRQLRLALPAVPAVQARAEAVPLRDGVADLYAVGTAFHWFDAAAALDEATRLLRPGGGVALLWNVRDESIAWVLDLTALVDQRSGGRPYVDHRERPWEDVVAAHGGFTPVLVQRHPNPVPTTVDGVLDRARSTSFVSAMDDDARAALLDEARALLVDGHGLEGTFDYPYETVLFTCRRAS